MDPYNSKAVRASAGSLFHLPVVTGTPVADAVRALRERGLRILAADGGAASTLDDLEAAGQLGRPTAWLFGNEAWGLPADVLDLADDGGGRAHLRPGGEPEPGRRGRGVPLRLGPRAGAAGAVTAAPRQT